MPATPTTEGVEKIGRHEHDLALRFVKAVSDNKKVKIHAWKNPNLHLGPVSITIEGAVPGDVGAVMDRDYDISCRPGLHCAPGTHRWLGTMPHGTIRFSFGYFNTPEHVDVVVKAVNEVSAKT